MRPRFNWIWPGGLLAAIEPGSDRPRFRVATLVGQVVVKGTIFSVSVTPATVAVSVLQGKVSVSRPGHGLVAVSAGETMRIDGAQQREMTPEEIDAMTRRARQLEGNGSERASERREDGQ